MGMKLVPIPLSLLLAGTMVSDCTSRGGIVKQRGIKSRMTCIDTSCQSRAALMMERSKIHQQREASGLTISGRRREGVWPQSRLKSNN